MVRCDICHNKCELNEGTYGKCRARRCVGGEVRCDNYGKITSIALDPIEKKPLNLFYPGSAVISVGSYGCNLRCPFCQNHDISYGFGKEYQGGCRYIAPDELADIALEYKGMGNIGVAFTYNEPLVGFEYVVDAAKEVHKRGMKTVLVSNGTAETAVLEEILPYIDAMNIDLKGFTDSYYRDFLGGDRELVMNFIQKSAGRCHVELTTLVVPGHNDSEDEMRDLSRWVAALDGGSGRETTALHISRYFPRFNLDRPPTPVEKIFRLTEVARENLTHVFPGNV